MSGREPIIEARHRGYGKLIRVFPNYVEIKEQWKGPKTIPMRQIHGADFNWSRTKLTLRTQTEDFDFVMVEAEEVQQTILQNL